MIVHQHVKYKNRNLFLDSENLIDDTNIKDRYRKIFVFIDQNELNQFKNVKTGKMMLINMSVCYNTTTYFANYGNYLKFCINMYIFNIDFINGYHDKLNAICSLDSAFSNSATNDLDRKQYIPDESNMYKYIPDIGKSMTKEFLLDFEYHSNNVIPDPRYYTPEHQFLAEGEEPTPLNNNYNLLTYRMEELLDKGHSQYVIYPFNQWASFKEQKLRELRKSEIELSQEYAKNSDLLINSLFSYNSENLIEGLIFSYDSCAGKVNVHKMDKVQPTISFSKFRFPEQIIDAIEIERKNLENSVKVMEEVHGNLLLFYCPFAHGDKLTVKFRDYNVDNQPKVADSDKIDKIYGMNSLISETINDFDEIE